MGGPVPSEWHYRKAAPDGQKHQLQLDLEHSKGGRVRQNKQMQRRMGQVRMLFDVDEELDILVLMKDYSTK